LTDAVGDRGLAEAGVDAPPHAVSANVNVAIAARFHVVMIFTTFRVLAYTASVEESIQEKRLM